jgi:hypothetical protein
MRLRENGKTSVFHSGWLRQIRQILATGVVRCGLLRRLLQKLHYMKKAVSNVSVFLAVIME